MRARYPRPAGFLMWRPRARACGSPREPRASPARRADCRYWPWSHARQAHFVKRADLNMIGLDVAELEVTSLQATGEVEKHPLVRKRDVQGPTAGRVGERNLVHLGPIAQHP